ncbi:MAG: HAD hydrolase-like protein, partial [Parabacteroides sp.]|nr:HAD hydrolase-like protein [Parabacteroides sp.]
MGYKHLVFDIDGTLVDNEKAVLSTWQETILQLFGKRYETSELNFVLGIPGVTTMERLGAENPKEFDEVWVK